MKREYRKQLEYNSNEDGKVNLKDALNIIEIVENEVNTIKDMLEEYTNLTEIKTIYKLLEELSDKLY